jgi:hypothetical protein
VVVSARYVFGTGGAEVGVAATDGQGSRGVANSVREGVATSRSGCVSKSVTRKVFRTGGTAVSVSATVGRGSRGATKAGRKGGDGRQRGRVGCLGTGGARVKVGGASGRGPHWEARAGMEGAELVKKGKEEGWDEDFLSEEDGEEEHDSKEEELGKGVRPLSEAEYKSLLECSVEATIALVDSFYPLPAGKQTLWSALAQHVIQSGIVLLDKVFTESDALTWAAGYDFPAGAVAEGERLFEEAGGDLAAMERARMEFLKPVRVNKERIGR